jgi:hypothetical protein
MLLKFKTANPKFQISNFFFFFKFNSLDTAFYYEFSRINIHKYTNVNLEKPHLSLTDVSIKGEKGNCEIKENKKQK